MNNMITNIKSRIYTVAVVILSLAVMFSLVACSGKGKAADNASNETAEITDSTDKATEDTTDKATSDDTTKEEPADDTTEKVDTTKPADSTSATDTTVTTDSATEDTTNTSVSDPGTVEITGPGSASQPYLEIPTADMTVTTASVPTGAALYYDIYRVGGMCLTINDANAYVICDNLLYEPINGQIYFQVPNALASDTVSFQIGNSGSSATSFTLIFTSPLGSYSNPGIVEDIATGVNVDLPEGTETGFFFKHTAKQTGTIRFYIYFSVDSVFLVTNNRNSAQITLDADGQTDSAGNKYVEIQVNKGDELLINVGAVPNQRGKYPAVQIAWNGVYN